MDFGTLSRLSVSTSTGKPAMGFWDTRNHIGVPCGFSFFCEPGTRVPTDSLGKGCFDMRKSLFGTHMEIWDRSPFGFDFTEMSLSTSQDLTGLWLSPSLHFSRRGELTDLRILENPTGAVSSVHDFIPHLDEFGGRSGGLGAVETMATTWCQAGVSPFRFAWYSVKTLSFFRVKVQSHTFQAHRWQFLDSLKQPKLAHSISFRGCFDSNMFFITARSLRKRHLREGAGSCCRLARVWVPHVLHVCYWSCFLWQTGSDSQEGGGQPDAG